MAFHGGCDKGSPRLRWLLTIHWLRLPHPATAIGWVLLAAYLGGTLPLFVAAARWMTMRDMPRILSRGRGAGS
ncbi:MAG: hypothetical protein EBX36_10805 [Planctomycetia bacterium]|nr:hypothetical protein [Planctomycetia bacterium]